MSNLSDFLKCEKVRCVNNKGYVDLANGKEYEVIKVIKEIERICLIDNKGDEYCYPYGIFEPVIENAIQASNKLDNTPMGTRTVNEFEVGDLVYYKQDPKLQIITMRHDDGKLLLREVNPASERDSHTFHTSFGKEICHATPENYEMLCKLYPHIEFEKPPVVLQGSDLARLKIKQGETNLSCYVGNNGDSTDNKRAIVSGYNNSGQFYTDFGLFNNAVPFDPKSGNVLTSEVLDD